jgi:hypothetical protein
MEPMDSRAPYLPNLESLVEQVKEASHDWDSDHSNLVVLLDNHLDYILGGMVIVDLQRMDQMALHAIDQEPYQALLGHLENRLLEDQQVVLVGLLEDFLHIGQDQVVLVKVG